MLSNTTSIKLVKKSANVGDCDQLNGVGQATLDYFAAKEQPATIHEIEIDNFTHSSVSNNSIIIAAGLEGIAALMQAQTEPGKRHLNVYLTHQWYPEIELLIKAGTANTTATTGTADLIALPSHAVTEEIINKFANSLTTLIITTGVCHNVQVKDIIAEYNLFKNQFLEAKQSIGIVLAGDAPCSSKTWFYFTPQEAENLANFIANYLHETKALGANLLVTNGPRTGKFIAEGEEDKKAHRNGTMDLVTKKFMQTLDHQGIKNTQLFDFQYDAPSAFKAILGALRANETASEIFLPGESISMISQGLDVLQKTSMIIYMNSAMNATHTQYVNEVYASGKAKILTKDKEIQLPMAHNAKFNYLPAREKVAEQIMKRW